MKKTNFNELATAVCDRAGVAYDSIEILTTWEQKFTDSDNFRNNAVFRIGNQQILKIFARNSEQRFRVERAALETLSAQDTIPAPRLIAAGERSDLPPYVIMMEIGGETLQNMWDSLTRTELLAVAEEIGSLTLALHQLPTEKLAEAEKQVGGRCEYIKEEAAKRQVEIEALEILSVSQKDDLLKFLVGGARDFMDVRPLFTHSDFSHAHVYLAQEADGVKVGSFIDWGEAMLGPPEWDTTFHWFWTFSRDQEAMRACLRGYYPDGRLPERFARRCFSVHMYSYSMQEVWAYFVKNGDRCDDIVNEMVEFYFPRAVFGPPD